MRFNCGPTWAERRILKDEQTHKRLTQWHPFYCWLPRRVDDKCVWLEWIQRKGRQEYCGYSLTYIFQYRFNPIEEMLNDEFH